MATNGTQRNLTAILSTHLARYSRLIGENELQLPSWVLEALGGFYGGR